MKLVLQCVSAVSAIVLVGGGDVSAQTSQSEAMRVQPQGLIGTAPQAGSSVAVDGDVLVVGVPGNANPGVNAGAAFVYQWNGYAWDLIGDLTSSLPPMPGDSFGASVAIDGDWIAVGAPGDGSSGLTNAGVVHVYKVIAGSVVYIGPLYDSSPEQNAGFGTSVAIDDTVLVAGAPYATGTLPDEGRATVFEVSGSAWSTAGLLISPTGTSDEKLGMSVDVSGTTILCGAPGTDSAQGTVLVYIKTGGGWQQWSSFVSPVQASDNRFGYSVAIEGDYVIVGEPGSDVAGIDAGMAYAYQDSLGAVVFSWVQDLQPAWLSPGDAMGMSVAIDGTTALVGIPVGQGIGVDTGRVDRWVQSGGTYTHTNLFYGSDLGSFDTATLGWSVSASGHLNVGGAPAADSDTGVVYVFSNQQYWQGGGVGDWNDAGNWSGNLVPNQESEVLLGRTGSTTIDIGGANCEAASLDVFEGVFQIVDTAGLGYLLLPESGGGITIGGTSPGATSSLEFTGLSGLIVDQTTIGRTDGKAGEWTVDQCTIDAGNIAVTNGSFLLTGGSVLDAVGVMTVGDADFDGEVVISSGSTLFLEDESWSTWELDIQRGLVELAGGSGVECMEVGANIAFAGTLAATDGQVVTPILNNAGRIISDVSSGDGFSLTGPYYQIGEDDEGNIITGQIVVKGLDVGVTGITMSSTANLGGGCVVYVNDPDSLVDGQTLDVLSADTVGDQFDIWMVPAIGTSAYLDIYYSALLGSGSDVSLVVTPLGATFGFNLPVGGETQTGSPAAMEVIDLNGDGADDVLVAVTGTSSGGDLDVWLNDGSGTLCLDGSYTTGADAFAMTTADFDQDGSSDCAVVLPLLDKAKVFINDGNGVFSLAATLSTGEEPRGITAFSLGGDVLPDLAVTNYSDDTLQTWENNTTLAMPVSFSSNGSVGTVIKPKPVKPGSVGGSGGKDESLLVGGQTEGGAHSADLLRRGLGDVDVFATGGEVVSLAVLDIDGNGLDDVAVTLASGDGLSVVMNRNGTGFQSPTLDASGLAGGDLHVGDLDGDSDEDLIFIEIDDVLGTNSVVAMRNDSSVLSRGGDDDIGMLARSELGAVGRGAADHGLIGSGDIDGDGAIDVVQVVEVLTDYQLIVQTSIASAEWSPDTCVAPCGGDINEDGGVDVDDLLALIGNWGPCDDPGNCPSDLDDSGSVDVDDLLMLLSAWGPC